MSGIILLTTLTACAGTSTSTTDSTSSSENPDNEKVVISSHIDGKDVDIVYDKVPERIVSGASCTTEMLLSLGLADKMVGYFYLDNPVYPDYEEVFSKIPELSKEEPSREELLAVKPDFFTGWVANMEEGSFDMTFCEQNGIKQYAPRVDAQTAKVDTVYEDLTNLGKIFHKEERAEELIADMKEKIEATHEKIKDKEPVSVFLYDSSDDKPLTVGTGLASDLISLAGGENIYGSDFEYWANVSIESVVEKNPEYILVVDYYVSGPVQDKIDFIKTNEALKNVDAVKNDNILVIDFTDVTGGIRNADIVEEMAEFFHPDAF